MSPGSLLTGFAILGDMLVEFGSDFQLLGGWLGGRRASWLPILWYSKLHIPIFHPCPAPSFPVPVSLLRTTGVCSLLLGPTF